MKVYIAQVGSRHPTLGSDTVTLGVFASEARAVAACRGHATEFNPRMGQLHFWHESTALSAYDKSTAYTVQPYAVQGACAICDTMDHVDHDCPTEIRDRTGAAPMHDDVRYLRNRARRAMTLVDGSGTGHIAQYIKFLESECKVEVHGA